jgi:hypothetical protein
MVLVRVEQELAGPTGCQSTGELHFPWRNIILLMEVASTFVRSLYFYQMMWHNNPEDSNLLFHILFVFYS